MGVGGWGVAQFLKGQSYYETFFGIHEECSKLCFSVGVRDKFHNVAEGVNGAVEAELVHCRGVSTQGSNGLRRDSLRLFPRHRTRLSGCSTPRLMRNIVAWRLDVWLNNPTISRLFSVCAVAFACSLPSAVSAVNAVKSTARA